MNASLDGSVVTQNWGDSWRLGFDNEAIYLSGNMFNTSGIFQYAKIRVLKKSDVYNPATTTLPYQEIGSATAKLKNADTSVADSLVPIRLRGTPNSTAAGLFVNAASLSVLPATYLTVWKIADPLATTLTVTSSTVSGLMSYNVPAPAPQLASSVTIDSGDTRVLKAIYRSGFLYTARNTGYTDQATTVTYDVINTSTMKSGSQARLMNMNAFYPAFDVPATTPSGSPVCHRESDYRHHHGARWDADLCGTFQQSESRRKPFLCSLLLLARLPLGRLFRRHRRSDIGRGVGVRRICETALDRSGIGQWGTWAGYYPWLTTQTFNDVPSSSSFFDYINVLSSWQITTGCSSAPNPPLFCPTDLVTRDQLATFIIRSMLGDTFTYTPTPYFTDVPASSPFFPYIQKLADLGLTHGCTPTTYCPTGTVPRMDASVLLVRGKLESLFGDKFTYPTTPFFTDVPATLPQFPYVQKMYELGTHYRMLCHPVLPQQQLDPAGNRHVFDPRLSQLRKSDQHSAISYQLAGRRGCAEADR